MLAIDPSLNSSGYAYRRDDDMMVGRIMPKTLRGSQRLNFIQNTFMDLVDKCQPEAVILEGYSMGSHGRVFDIGELGGVLKLISFQHELEVLIVPPATLKKWVTGKGNANKKQMIAAVKKRWKYEFKSNDECDAVALLHFGEFYYEQKNKRRKSPEIREMLAKCWIEPSHCN